MRHRTIFVPYLLRRIVPREIPLGPVYVVPHPLIPRRQDRSFAAHAHYHARSQRAVGLLRWCWKYVTDRAWRQVEETGAFGSEVEFLGESAATAMGLYRAMLQENPRTFTQAEAHSALQEMGLPAL